MGVLRILLPLLLLAPLDAADDEASIDDHNRFASDLYAKLAAKPGNLCVSPLSVRTALAMTYAGARGETARQMAAVLHFPGNDVAFHRALGAYGRDLAAPGDAGAPEFHVANAIWAQRGDTFLEPFLRIQAEQYGAGVRQLDFRQGTEHARRTINGWVEKQTRDKIRELLRPGILSPLTAMVLTNALYLRADWLHPFPKRATRDGEFILSADEQVQVPMMHLTAKLPYLMVVGETADQWCEAVELPYRGARLSMVLILPGSNKQLMQPELGTLLGELRPATVAVTMPRFAVTSAFSMVKTLAGMGMPIAFGGGADFSGMDGTKSLFISAVEHKAFVEVNEAGTEAAAATAVVMARKGRPVAEERFTADRPFVFLIRDRKSGRVLFIGRVADPRPKDA